MRNQPLISHQPSCRPASLTPRSPEDAKWLQEDERAYIKARLQADQGHNAAERSVTFRDVAIVMSDLKVWLGGMMYLGLVVPAYSYAFFSPAILQTYNYNPIETQLHSVPPWVAAFGFGMLVAFASDFARHRFLFAIGPICIAVCVLAVCGWFLGIQKIRRGSPR